MKIYTKTGDAGETGLFGGTRVKKDDPLVETYGAIDELNAALGAAVAALVSGAARERLIKIQADLFVLGAELAAIPERRANLRLALLNEADVTRLEGWIDADEAQLPALKSFILPGGSPAAASLHLARAVCRRAERRFITAVGIGDFRPELGVYLNRLGDLLFVMARKANLDAGVPDVPWNPRSER